MAVLYDITKDYLYQEGYAKGWEKGYAEGTFTHPEIARIAEVSSEYVTQIARQLTTDH